MRKLFLGIAISLLGLLGTFSFLPMLAAADCANPVNTQESIACGAGNGAGVPDSNNAGTRLDNTIHNGVNLLSVVIGVIAVIMIVMAGFRYITSSGQQDKVAGAKNTLIYAIIGLVIVALAQSMTKLILKKTG